MRTRLTPAAADNVPTADAWLIGNPKKG